MPWSLLRNTESKFLIYTGTDMLTVAFVYLSSRSKQRQQKIRFAFFRHSKAYRCHCINLSISTMNCIFIFFSILPFFIRAKDVLRSFRRHKFLSVRPYKSLLDSSELKIACW